MTWGGSATEPVAPSRSLDGSIDGRWLPGKSVS